MNREIVETYRHKTYFLCSYISRLKYFWWSV